MKEYIHNTLRNLGITKRYKGYDYCVHAVYIAACNANCLKSIVKEIYIETARKYNCSWISVERDIRTVVNKAWKTNPTLLQKIAGFPLSVQPKVSEFIDMVSAFILREACRTGRYSRN